MTCPQDMMLRKTGDRSRIYRDYASYRQLVTSVNTICCKKTTEFLLDNCRILLYNGPMMNEGDTMFQVTKLHTAGILTGMTTTETTSVKFPVGFVCQNAIGGGSYIVTKVMAIA